MEQTIHSVFHKLYSRKDGPPDVTENLNPRQQGGQSGATPQGSEP